MVTAVYLSGRNIQILTGEMQHEKAKVTSAYELRVPDECLINGIVTDENLLSGYLSEFWAKQQIPRKNVTLVVNSSQLVVKLLELPKLKPDNLLDIIKNEFSDVERHSEPLFGYSILSETRKTFKLLASMAERRFIEGYINFFKSINIEINSFQSAAECSVRFLGKVPFLKDRSCIVQLMDDNNINNILWIEGQYQHASRVRLFSEHGTESQGEEIGRSVNNLLQFYSSLKQDKPLNEIYIGGMPDEDMAYYSSNIESLNMSIKPLESERTIAFETEGKKAGDFAFPLGSLFYSKKDWDLLSIYKKNYQTREMGKKLFKRLAPIAAVVVILLFSTVLLNMYTGSLQNQASELLFYLSNPANLERSIRSEDYEQEEQALSGKVDDVRTLLEALGTYPKLDSETRALIISAGADMASAEIKSYDGNTGAVTIKASCKEADGANKYIANLEQLGIFSSIEYSGYSYNETTETYQIGVVGYMKAVGAE